MLTGEAAGYEPQFITPVQPLFRELSWLLFGAGIAITGLGVAYYEEAGDDARGFFSACWTAGQAACSASTSSATGQIVQPCAESAARSRFVQCLHKCSLYTLPLRSARCTARTAGPQRSQVSFISISLFEGGA